MRFKLIILFLLTAFVTQAQNFYTGYSDVLPTIAHPNNITSAPFWINQTRSDTTVITGSALGSSYYGNVNGVDSMHPCVVYYNNTIGAGVAIENCHYFKAIAVGSNHGQLTSGGVPLVVKGKVDYIQASGFIVTNGVQGGIWVKTEVADACSYPIPDDYIYPNHMKHIWVTDCRVGNRDGSALTAGDAFYIGSTGSAGGRPMPCKGNSTTVKPMYMQTVQALRDTVFGVRRSAIQMSGTDSGDNKMNYCYIYNVGNEYVAGGAQGKNQGAGIRTGYGDSTYIEIAYNTIVKTWLYNLDLETGANVHDNYVDSAGLIKYNGVEYRNTDQIQNVLSYAMHPNALLLLYNNKSGGHSTQPQAKSYTIYGGNNFRTTGNKICNNVGTVSIEALPFNYTTDCGVIPPLDTGCVNHDTTFYRDSYVTGHFPAQYKDTTVKIFKADTGWYKFKTRGTVRFIQVGAMKDSTYQILVRAAYDSTYICSLCQRIDTTICVPRVKTVGWGSFILDGYNSLTTPAQKIHYTKTPLQLNNIRSNYVFGNSWGNQQYLDSGINPIPTINTESVSTGPHSLPTNGNYIQNYVDSLFKISKPPVAAWLNELGTIVYWDSTGGGVAVANKYLSTFNPFISACHANGVKATDGGITYSVIYSLADYYTRTGKTDSLTYLRTATGISNFTASPRSIYWRDLYNTLLTGIRNGQADYVQLHFYGDTLSVPNKLLTVVSNYIVQQTGKPIVCFETGTDLSSQANFNSFFTEWTKQSPAYLLYFLGTGPNSVPNEGFFLTLKRQILNF